MSSEGSVSYRPLAWPADAAELARLDTSFTASERFETVADGLGFVLVERRLPSPLTKRYEISGFELASNGSVVIAERNGHILGVLSVTRSDWNRRAVVSHLYVDRPARLGGIGTGLLHAARAIAERYGARSLWVETQDVNLSAIRFYLARGFAICGLDTSLYDPLEIRGESAVFLEMPLESWSAGRRDTSR